MHDLRNYYLCKTKENNICGAKTLNLEYLPEKNGRVSPKSIILLKPPTEMSSTIYNCYSGFCFTPACYKIGSEKKWSILMVIGISVRSYQPEPAPQFPNKVSGK